MTFSMKSRNKKPVSMTGAVDIYNKQNGRICYACASVTTFRNFWYLNRDIEHPDIALHYLCLQCYDRIIRRPKKFRTKEERIAWFKAQNKGQVPPNKGQRLYPNRKCDNCGSTKTFVDKRGIEHWRHIRDEFGKSIRLLCCNCYSRLYSNKKECRRIWSEQRIVFKGKERHLDRNPRIGVCNLCRAVRGEINCQTDRLCIKTHMHHEAYHEDDILRETIECCQSCHTKRHHELRQLGKKNQRKLKRIAIA